MSTSPYHAGEWLVQQRLGEQHIADRNAPCILTEIADNVGPFLRAQTLAAVSSRDAAGQVWTSLLLGAPGCAWAPTPTQLRLEEALLKPSPADVLWHNLREHSEVSVLFIDLGTRWRYRVNGRAHAVAGAWTVAVEQAFLNCPQYIHKRALALVPGDAGPSVVPTTGTNLTPELLEWIAAADMFFVGSGTADWALDTAHRGGPSGFVRAEAGGTLLVLDYVGNSMYNSLGNFLVNPAAGLLFVDFAGGRTLQLTGRTETVWQLTDAATGGTGRGWRFVPVAWAVLPVATPLRATLVEQYPFSPSVP